jgi:hypothetical protein
VAIGAAHGVVDDTGHGLGDPGERGPTVLERGGGEAHATALAGDVAERDHHVGDLAVGGGARHGVGEQPVALGAATPHAEHHVALGLAGDEHAARGSLLRRERGAVGAHDVPGGIEGGDAEDLFAA